MHRISMLGDYNSNSWLVKVGRWNFMEGQQWPRELICLMVPRLCILFAKIVHDSFYGGGGEEAIISPILPSPICIHPKLGCVYLFTMIVDVLYLLIYTIKSWCIESVPLSKWFLSVDKFIINYINITLESQRHKKTNTISSVHQLWVTFSFKGLSKTWHKCLSYVVIIIIIIMS